MPYLATLTDRDWIVRPVDFGSEFNRDTEIECPHCGREMVFRKCGGRDDHFAHTPDSVEQSGNTGSSGSGGCEHAGESETHERMKKKAITQLRKEFPEFESITVEKRLDSQQGAEERRADVAGIFEEPHEDYGKGILVEVQYRNNSKDYLGTTWDYTRHEGYSICWVFYDNWEELFDAKEYIREHLWKPIRLGHTQSLDEPLDLGKPILPPEGEHFPSDVVENYGGSSFCIKPDKTDRRGWEPLINTLTACIAAREAGEINPRTAPDSSAMDAIVEFFTPLEIDKPINADNNELRMINDIYQNLSLDDIAQRFNHRAIREKYEISKSELTVFSVGCIPEELEHERCEVCEQNQPDCRRWQWSDTSGASPFSICRECREKLVEDSVTCPLCDSDEKMSRSEGFGPMGPRGSVTWYDGCDWCRKMVLFTDEPVERFTTQ